MRPNTALLTTIREDHWTMAWETLTDFFAAYHNCRNWDLQKAVMHCASRANSTWQNDPGIKREILEKAAYAWQPESHFHKTLKRLMVSDDPSLTRLTGGQVTPTVTRVRKELEAWLRERYPSSPPPPPPPPLRIKSIWDIFNAKDRYSKDNIKGGIWHIMYGDYGDNDAWKLPIQWHARWRTAESKWERELIQFILTENPKRPEPRTTAMYNLARRTKAWLSRNSTYCPNPIPGEKLDGRPRTRPQHHESSRQPRPGA